MIQINRNIVFVQGAINGALYNFNDGEVYSLNANSCLAIRKSINGEPISSQEKEYINLLKQKGLFDKKNVKKYSPQRNKQQLDLCWLEITQLCNCKCIHCYEGCNHLKSENPLSLREWKSVIDQLTALNVERAIIIGGEPCTHPDIERIIAFTAERIKNVTLFTNGTLMTNSLKRTIVENNVKLKFSIYGHCSEIHDSITKMPGSFEKLMQSIRYFKNMNIDIHLAVVIMRENEQYLHDILQFLNNLELPYKVDVIREVFGGVQSLHIPENQNIIKDVKRTKPLFTKITKKKFDKAFYYNTCWAGKIVITENGDVLPCVFERNKVLGNVIKQPIVQIIQSPPTKKCWETTFADIEVCQCCEFRFACKDCRPLANSFGNANYKNPRCTYNALEGKWN